MKFPRNPNDVVEWDVTNWSKGLKLWAKLTQLAPSKKLALEIGSRNGGLSLWLGMNGMNVICSDLNSPTVSAAKLHERYGIKELVQYEAIDALNIPYSEKFDLIIFKSVLGGIGSNNNLENQKKAIDQFHKALKNGGELWFAENLVASPIHQLFRKKFVPWGNRWRYVSIEEMKMFFSQFSEIRFSTFGFLGSFGRAPLQRKLFGLIDSIVFDHFLPDNWHYIIAGIAKK